MLIVSFEKRYLNSYSEQDDGIHVSYTYECDGEKYDYNLILKSFDDLDTLIHAMGIKL